MKRFLCIFLAVMMVLSMAACAKKEETTTETTTTESEPKVLKIATKGNPSGLCPVITAVSSSNTPVHEFVFDRLFEYDSETGTATPMLATACEQIDETHYRLTIRDDVYDYSGENKFTANDVLFTFKLAIETAKASNYWNKYFNLDEFKVEDDTHIIIGLISADPFIMTALSNIPYGMICEASYTNADEQSLLPTCSTGPYYVKEWIADSKITLARNENYWGDTPYYDEIELQIITDASARVMALEAGDVDICLEPSLATVADIEANDALTVISEPTSNNYTLFLNNQKAPFDDIHARRACALALNYDGNLKIAANGYGITCDSILPKTNKYYVSPSSQGYTSYYHYDLEAAKAEWAQSKYAGQSITVELMYAEGATWESYATLIQQQWAELGITVTPSPMATSKFYEEIAAGNHQAEMINNSSPDPQQQYNFYRSDVDFKTARGGAGCAEIPGFLEKLEAAKLTTDESERAALYAEIQKILDDYVPSIPLYTPTKVCYVRKGIEGIILTTVGDINASKAYEN